MGILSFIRSKSEAEKSESEHTKYGAGKECFYKFAAAVATPVKTVCRNSYNHGSAACTKIYHTVRPSAEAEAEKTELTRYDAGKECLSTLTAAVATPVKTVCQNSYDHGSAAFTKIYHTVRPTVLCRTACDEINTTSEISAEVVETKLDGVDATTVKNCGSFGYGFYTFAKIGYTVRVKGVYRTIQWVSDAKSTIRIYIINSNHSQNAEELHESGDGGAESIPGSSVPNCEAKEVGHSTTFWKWIADDDIHARFAKVGRIGLFALSVKHRGIDRAVEIISGIIQEKRRASKVEEDELSRKSLAEEVVSATIFFFSIISREPFVTQLRRRGGLSKESMVFVIKEYIVFTKPVVADRFPKSVAVIELVYDRYGDDLVNYLGLHGSPIQGKNKFRNKKW